MESILISTSLAPILPPDAPSREAEELLIDSALKGRSDAFGDLVQPHLTSLSRFARARLGNESEAEDIVQQTVLRAFSHLGQFRRESSFKTWLSAIASNEVIQWRRGQAIAPIRPLNDVQAANLVDPSTSPHIQCQRSQEVERLRQAITRLPEKDRQMIQLRDFHELSVAETARELSLTVAAVKTRHHRARKRLVRALARRSVN